MNIISLNFTKVEESKNTEFSVHDSFIHVIKTKKIVIDNIFIHRDNNLKIAV